MSAILFSRVTKIQHDIFKLKYIDVEKYRSMFYIYCYKKIMNMNVYNFSKRLIKLIHF